MAMIYCVECGAGASPKAPNCPQCGHPLQEAAPPASAPVVNVNVTQNQQNEIGGGVVVARSWSPLVAAILSFFIPGLGQLYKGQPINGLVWFVLVFLGYVAFVFPGFVLHVCCVLGAAMGDPNR